MDMMTARSQVGAGFDEMTARSQVGAVIGEMTEHTRSPVETRNEGVSELPAYAGHVRLRKCWKDLRESKMIVKSVEDNWKDLESMEKKKIERSGKELRAEIEERRRAKFGKAGRRKLTSLEETILANQTKKKIELEEIGRNFERRQKKRTKLSLKDEMMLEAEWTNLNENLNTIICLERWVTAKVMEESSLEEKRCMIFGSEAENKTRDARPATARRKSDARLSTIQEETEETTKTAKWKTCQKMVQKMILLTVTLTPKRRQKFC